MILVLTSSEHQHTVSNLKFHHYYSNKGISHKTTDLSARTKKICTVGQFTGSTEQRLVMTLAHLQGEGNRILFAVS